MASAPSDLAVAPYLITSTQVASGVWGAANFKRYYHQILTLAARPDLPAGRLIVGETFTPSGNYFKVNPADGFGLCRYYNEAGEEENFTVRDNGLHSLPRGYHTVVSARLYHLLLVVPGGPATPPGRGG